ncbi:MAG: hypothetical protein EOP50_11180, partial [Sphingobacteriales bacterium]
MSANRISELLPQSLIDQTKTSALELMHAWQPHLLTIDPTEKEGMAQMGAARAAVARDAEEIVAVNPQFMPAYKNLDDFKTDMANAKQLRPVIEYLKNVTRELETLLLVSESEAACAFA